MSLVRTASILWRLTRPHTLTASFLPVLVGAALTRHAASPFRGGRLAAMLACAALMQIAANCFNEYYDFLRGVDTADSTGIAGAITRDGVRPRAVLGVAVLSLALASASGLWLCAQLGWPLFALGAASALAAYLYTGGPRPIASTPFGELVAGGFMGSGLVLLSIYVQTGGLSARGLLASAPFFLLVAAILTANNLRDIVGDVAAGRRTLVILLGRARAWRFLSAILVAAHAWLVALVLAQTLPPSTLLALLGTLPAASAMRLFRDEASPAACALAMKRVAQTNTVFGAMLIVGLWIA